MRPPRILVVYKRSPLIDAGTSAAASSDRFQSNHSCHYETLKAITHFLRQEGLAFSQHLRGVHAAHNIYDIIITVGGDGTFLDAGRRSTEKQLIIGVNSDPSWSVGQFCVANSLTFPEIFKRTLTRPRFRKLYKLELKFPGGNVLRCLNDVLICHANPAAMSRYTITVGKKSEFHRSSGLWISSAAGATGAIASAGGQEMPLESRLIQYKPRELYRAPSGRRDYRMTGGTVLPSKTIEITSRMPHGRVYCDGAHLKYPLTFSTTLQIASSSHFVRMVHA